MGVACANGATRTSLRRGSSAWSNGPTRVTLSVLMSSVPPSVFAMSCIRLVLPLPGAPFRRLGEVHAMRGQPEASSSPQSPPGSSCSQSISRDVSNSTGTDGLQTTNGSSPPASRSRSAIFAFWLQRCVCWKQPGVSKTSCAYNAWRNARRKRGTVKPMSDAVCISSSGTPNQRGPDEASRLLRAAIRSAASELEEGMAARLSLDSARASVGSMGALVDC